MIFVKYMYHMIRLVKRKEKKAYITGPVIKMIVQYLTMIFAYVSCIGEEEGGKKFFKIKHMMKVDI